MEGDKKPIGSPSSSSFSFTNELFGTIGQSSSIDSIFPPPSKVMGRDAQESEVTGKKHESVTGKPEDSSEESKRNKIFDDIFEGQRGRVDQPFNLSSSIYYGGQDMYLTPQTSQGSSAYKKNAEDDDPHAATRGEWWQGSFYY